MLKTKTIKHVYAFVSDIFLQIQVDQKEKELESGIAP